MSAIPQFAGISGTGGSATPQFSRLIGSVNPGVLPQFSRLFGRISALLVDAGLGGVAYPFDTCQLSATVVSDGVSADTYIWEQVFVGSEPAVTLVGLPVDSRRTYVAPGTLNGCELYFRVRVTKAGFPDAISDTVKHTIRAHGWSWSGTKAIRGPYVGKVGGSQVLP